MTGRGCPIAARTAATRQFWKGGALRKNFCASMSRRPWWRSSSVCVTNTMSAISNSGMSCLSNLKFVRAFLEIYKERIGLPFSINSRVEVMNEEFCQTAAEAGCHTIWFGIESGDEEYRANMLGRKMKNQQIIDAADNCKKAGINRLTFNIVGAPLETAANMRETLKLNQRIAPEHFFFFRTFRCAGRLYNIAKKEGLLLETKKICTTCQRQTTGSSRLT